MRDCERLNLYDQLKFAYIRLVYHFDAIPESLWGCSANHLFVRFFSAKTTFIRFMFLVICVTFIIGKDTSFFLILRILSYNYMN